MNHCMKKLIGISVSFFVFVCMSFAQRTKTILLDKIESNCTATKVDFKVRVTNFTNITSFQGAIGWDNSILKLDSLFLKSSNCNIKLDDSIAASIQPNDNYLNFVWSDTIPHSVPDSSVLFSLRFSISNPSNNHSPVYFIRNDSNLYYILEIDTFDVANQMMSPAIDTAFSNGYISFADSPVIINKGNKLFCVAACSPSGYQWYFNGNPIQNETSGSVSIAGNGLYSVSVFYTSGNRLNSLPVNIGSPPELISFNAARLNNVTSLKWATNKPVGTTWFNIGRKVNDGEYKTITTVNAKDNYELSEFTFNDNDVLRGDIYYQLQIVNQDNKQYSKIVSVNINKENEYRIYPNTTKDKMNVEGENISKIEVMDNSGRVILRKRFSVVFNNTSKRIIDISKLEKGLYVMKIFNLDGSDKVEKLVIN